MPATQRSWIQYPRLADHFEIAAMRMTMKYPLKQLAMRERIQHALIIAMTYSNAMAINDDVGVFAAVLDVAQTSRLRAETHPVIIVVSLDKPNLKTVKQLEHQWAGDITTMHQPIHLSRAENLQPKSQVR